MSARHASLLTALLLLALALGAGHAAVAGEDPLEEAKSLVELGTALVEAGTDMEDAKRLAQGIAKFKEARAKFKALLEQPGLTAAQKNRIQRHIVDVESRIDWYSTTTVGGGADRAEPEAEVQIPELKRGERLGPWCRRVRRIYDATEEPAGRAALARGLAAQAGVLALPTLYDLFRTEELPGARDGIHEALATVGTSRVAREMASYARRDREEKWSDALDVIYRCLEKPERNEKERPFQRAIRAFHELKDLALSREIVRYLDHMGTPGIAALGEVVYVDDFGLHDHVIGLLAKKRDRRAVPPLVFKMNRFKFEYRVQMPAHEALLAMGWYAVPELVDRLDDKAAGIWISWTLRKISGETMGTDKRKWHDWWKTEKLRHPEVFADPDEAKPVVTKDPEPAK